MHYNSTKLDQQNEAIPIMHRKNVYLEINESNSLQKCKYQGPATADIQRKGDNIEVKIASTDELQAVQGSGCLPQLGPIHIQARGFENEFTGKVSIEHKQISIPGIPDPLEREVAINTRDPIRTDNPEQVDFWVNGDVAKVFDLPLPETTVWGSITRVPDSNPEPASPSPRSPQHNHRFFETMRPYFASDDIDTRFTKSFRNG